MKYLLLSIVICFAACTATPDERRQHRATDSAHADTAIKPDSIGHTPSNDAGYCLWAVDFEEKTKQKNSTFKQDWLNADTLITGLNQRYPDIKLEKLKLSGDTLYTKIGDPTYLTQRMGTTGAATYLADAIINLTSVKDIKYVQMDFEEGDHASPGTWTAADYNDFREIR